MRLVVLLGLLALTVVGAWALAFLCDDAYINFRYVSNLRDGLGLVWNPPPFLPVEGYTGILWVLLLWGTWGVFGIEPPDSANWLSILFGVAEFAVVACVALRLRRRDGSRVGDTIALVTLACIVGNRTFLQWMTSGLSTSLFNLAFVAWVLLAFRGHERRDVRWLSWWSIAAVVAALTRPDGLLLAAATGAAALPSLAVAHRSPTRTLLGLSPLLTVVAHSVWRRWFYGDWLPNTYYAKVVAPWPEAGVLYWKCFLFEHGLWLWFPVALVWLVWDAYVHRGSLFATAWRRVPALAALAVVAFHTGYYVLQVGGDHFEYRVFSQLVPLAWLSLAAMSAQLAKRTTVVLSVLATTFLFSTAGWLHLVVSQDQLSTKARKFEIGPLAHRLPAFLQPIWRWHDSMQLFLHMHFVCLRCNQHVWAHADFLGRYPPRGDTGGPKDDIPVLVEGAVGVAGWRLRDCAIIDRLGLNDWVVARTPPFGWDSVAGVPHLHTVLLAADVDGDGWWERSELERWFATVGSGPVDPVTRDPVIDMAFDLYGDGRREALSKAGAEAFLRDIFSRGSMAHERVPPAGYVEAFEPNVTVTPAGAVVAPRAVALKPRIPAIEAEWRDKVRRGELKR